MPSYKIFVLPTVIALFHGILSVLGLSQGYEYHFWLVAILVGILLIAVKKTERPLLNSILMGVLIASGTGIPQVLFLDTYFLNNPEYAELVNQLPITPRLYTFLMIPVFGVVIGLILSGTILLIRKIQII